MVQSQSEKTLSYYNENAQEFAKTTQSVDFKEIQTMFLKYLPEKAHILDFGCGSGRDAKTFLSRGFRVTAIDGSSALCQIASEYIGQKVKHMYFQDLNEKDQYEGIWACSSILHLNKSELHDVFLKMKDALKSNGYLYASFKYGDFTGIRNGRYFTDMTEVSLADFIRDIPELEIIEYRITGDVRVGREEVKWVNVILRKNIVG